MKKLSPLYPLLLQLAFLMQDRNIQAQCTSVILKPGAANGIHAHITSNHPTQNYGHDSLFISFAWTILGVPVESRGLMKFDLSQIPIGATVTSATLNLYADSLSTRGYTDEPTYGSNNASDLLLVTSPWDRDYVTWNTQPSTTPTNAVLLPQSSSYVENYLNLDVTNFAQSWVNDPNTNYGVMLKLVTDNFYNSMIFCSSDFGDSTLWPSLEICYIPQPACNTVAAFTYQHLGSGVVQFNNTSSSDSGYYSSWVFYNTEGIFANSNEQNPTITYAGGEPFYASLTVIDSAFSQCISSTDSLIDITTCIDLKPGPAAGYHANISSLQPGSNYETVPDFIGMQWADSAATAYEARGLMKFDLSQIPAGSTIIASMLNLYADTISTNGYPGQPMYGDNNSCNLLQITSGWNSSSVSWNNQPSTTTANQVLLGQTRGDNNYLLIDVSSFTQNWVNNPAQNYGVMLQMITQNYYNSMIFCSSDYPDSTLWPDLQICYIRGQIDSIQNDTLCGFVFDDVNNDGVYDSSDVPVVHGTVLVDGVVYYTDSAGYYQVSVGAGLHQIAAVLPFGWVQTSPLSPNTYSITTSTNEHICGFDFGISNTPTGIKSLSLSASDMVIFPNPVSGSSFNVLVPDGFEMGNASLQIQDMLGREISVQHTNVQQKQINVILGSPLVQGVYMVVLRNETNHLCGRLSVIK